MEIPPNKVKAAFVAVVAVSIGIGIPLLAWLQHQNVSQNLKGELDFAQVSQVAQPVNEAVVQVAEPVAEPPLVPASEGLRSGGDAATQESTSAAEMPQETAQSLAAVQTDGSSGTNPLTLNIPPAQTDASAPSAAPAPTINSTDQLSCKAQPALAKVGEKITWTAQNSADSPNGNYLWSGAVTGQGKSIDSVYDVGGKLTATVQYYDPTGKTSTAKCDVEVVASLPPAPSPTPPPAPSEMPVVANTPAIQPAVVTLSPNQSKCADVEYPKDIENSPARDAIKKIFDLCVSRGYADGNYRPELLMSRGWAIKFILLAAGIEPVDCFDKDCGTNFKDLQMGLNQWIRAAWNLRIVEDTTEFFPERPVTIDEAMKFIANTFKISQQDECMYTKQSCSAENLALYATRADMATLVVKTLQALGKLHN